MESISGMKVLYYSGNELGKTFELPEASENTLAIVRAGGKSTAVNNILNAEVPESPGFKMIQPFKTEMFLYKNGNWIWLPPEVSLDDMMYYVSKLTNDINAVDEKADPNAENITALDTRMSAAETKLEDVENNIASYPSLSIDASIGNLNTSFNTLYIGYTLFTTLYLHSTTEHQEFTVTLTYDNDVNLLPGATFSMVSNNTEVEVNRTSNTQLNCSIKNMPVGTTQILLISNCM